MTLGIRYCHCYWLHSHDSCWWTLANCISWIVSPVVSVLYTQQLRLITLLKLDTHHFMLAASRLMHSMRWSSLCWFWKRDFRCVEIISYYLPCASHSLLCKICYFNATY